MPDYYDMELDALPCLNEILIDACEHAKKEYIPPEPENNVSEDYVCVICSKSLPIPEEGDEQ